MTKPPVVGDSPTSLKESPSLPPRHSRSALGTFLLIARGSHLMGCSFTAVRANAITARACGKTTSLPSSATSSTLAPAPSSTLAAAALTHASACSRALASGACSVFSRHFAHLLGSLFTDNKMVPLSTRHADDRRSLLVKNGCDKKNVLLYSTGSGRTYSKIPPPQECLFCAVSSYSGQGPPVMFARQKRRSGGPPPADRQEH